MSEAETLSRYGLWISDDQRSEILRLLAEQAGRERQSQGEGDTLVMRLCAAQLFGLGRVEDAAAIWRAKSASSDAYASIDVHLLCGAGLGETLEWLDAVGDATSRKAAERIRECLAAGDFDGFSVETYRTSLAEYYASAIADGDDYE